MRTKVGILLLHGFTSSPRIFHDFIKHGRKLHPEFIYSAPLLAGHGASHHDLVKTTPKDWIASAAESLEVLQQECEEVVIIGASIGATIAVHLANRHRVSGIVLIGYPRRAYRQGLLKFAAIVLRITGINYYKKSKKYIDDEDSVFGITKKGNNYVPAKSALQVFKFAGKETDKLLPRIKVPTLLIQSDKDGLVRPDSALYAYTQIGAEEKLLTWVHEPHHRLHLGRSREQIYTLIEEFTAKHTT